MSAMKRRRLELSIRIEPGSDSAGPVHEVFPDGSYTPASESHFLRSSEAALSFVSRALFNPCLGSSVGLDTGANVVPFKREGREVHSGLPSVKDVQIDAMEIDDERESAHHVTAESTAPVATDSAQMSMTAASMHEERNVSATWPLDVISSIEGALSELGRAVAIIESLRTAEPLLELCRFHPESFCTSPSASQNSRISQVGGNIARLPGTTLKDGAAVLMAKRRALADSSEILGKCAASSRKWCERDKLFVQTCVALRKYCGALRRAPDGGPLVDVADGDFIAVERYNAAPEMSTNGHVEGTSRDFVQKHIQDLREGKEEAPALDIRDHQTEFRACNVRFRPFILLAFSFLTLDQDFEGILEPERTQNIQHQFPTLPIVATADAQHASANSEDALVGHIRKARVAAFNSITFDRMSQEALNGVANVEVTTNTVSLECGPRHLLLIRKSRQDNAGHHAKLRASASAKDENESLIKRGSGAYQHEIVRSSTDHRLCSIIARHYSLRISAQSERRSNVSILSHLNDLLSFRSTFRLLQNVLDDAAKGLHVFIDWSRSNSVPLGGIAQVWALDSDGDGPTRMLATLQPQTMDSNPEKEFGGNHVHVTPAFGIVVAAPDDPGSRSRSASYGAQLSTSGRSHQGGIVLDDVPRSYLCPVGGGEVMSVLTLLLCVRLLDALEASARTSGPYILDVDRQCFSIIVHAPETGRVLRAKVWPKGPSIGEEVPTASFWLDDQRVSFCPQFGQGRLASWRKLLSVILQNTDDTAPRVPGAEKVELCNVDGRSGRVNLMTENTENMESTLQRESSRRNENGWPPSTTADSDSI